MDFLWAFLIGGLFCAVGQVLIDYTKLTPARILVSYVVAGVVISAFGWYKSLAEFAGAGATVPLTGFGHLLAEGIRKSVDEKGFLGIFTGGMSSAAGGITAALLFGLLAALIFKPKDK
ncbi:MAG: stage V sporulation protein AE [Oscillospiraceae bacterium]|jgi:stage V sporulation protein AE|nr:stage V sporulation protein AE [Oscillospiraceae bacterium]